MLVTSLHRSHTLSLSAFAAMGVSNAATSRERSRSRGRDESVVPIIDIAALLGTDATARKDVAKAIGQACEDIGFFVVVNHGIPSEVVDRAWSQTLGFFDLPLDEKKKYISEDEAKNPYGCLVCGVAGLLHACWMPAEVW